MLFLPDNTTVSDEESFQKAVSAGLHHSFGLANGHRHFKLQGAWPEFDHVQLDLTDANVPLDRMPPAPSAPSQTLNSFQSRKLDILADPMQVGSTAKLHIRLHAKEARLDIARDAQAKNWLTLGKASDGTARLSISARDLEELFLSGARKAAGQHGVQIEEGSIALQPEGDNALRLSASIQAKKLFLKSQFHLEGKVRLDGSLNAHFSDLTCRGEGAIGTMAAGFLRPHLESWNSRTLPLMGLIFSDLELRNVNVSVSESNHLLAEASFGTRKAKT